MRKNEKITALYERLSRDDFGKDDDQQRESNSISNQKAMLEEFAARQGFTNIVHFTDDGISGTCFDRPGFLAMMKEVEAGNVEYLCIKDMSRMGRDYLKVGQIMEILRQRGVRLIAINDGVDSARGDDDFTPFRNIMNEYYARDTSRKIRSTFQSKGKSGKHLTGTVIYGYLWNEARDQWLVDPEAADVVKMCIRDRYIIRERVRNANGRLGSIEYTILELSLIHISCAGLGRYRCWPPADPVERTGGVHHRPAGPRRRVESRVCERGIPLNL